MRTQMMQVKGLAWGRTWGMLFLSLLFDGQVCPCHGAPCIWVSFSKMQQQPIESIHPRKGYGKKTVKRKPVLAGCFQWAKGHDDKRRRGIPPHLVGKSKSLEQVQSRGPQEGMAKRMKLPLSGFG